MSTATEIRKVTKQEIVEFIMAQPAERPLNMFESLSSDICGCPMVHFGREVLHIKEKFSCLLKTWSIELQPYAQIEDGDIFAIVETWQGTKTYGDIQARLRAA